jgi:outer membrane protein
LKQSIISILCVVITMLYGSVLYAVDIKIGFVDTTRVLKEAPQADIARQKLESEFAPRDKKIVTMQNELKKLDERLNRDVALMSSDTRNKLERELISLKRDIKRAREEFTEDFNIRRNEELSRLQKLIFEITVKLAEEDDYDVILTDSVLYTSKRVDVTEAVLTRLREINKLEQPQTEQ